MDSDSYRKRSDLLKQFLSEYEAEDILTPISMIQLINIEDTYDNIVNIITQNPHACYPVYKDGVDNILGILYIHDLLTCDSQEFDLNAILHYPMFISENKILLELLEEFKKKQYSFAVVVDEHGAVRGIVTKTDILDVFWNSEENDENLKEQIIEQDGQFIIDPRLLLEEFNKKFSMDLSCENCDSIGGYVIEKFTYVPQFGEELQDYGMIITISRTEGAKLLELTVKFTK
ncbi:MAG: CBS domain-containing protein [Brevinema sp.]